MRTLLAAVTAVLVGVALVAQLGHAHPSPPMEQRPVEKVIAALQARKDRKADLAAVRFNAEVFGATTVSAPVGSPLDALGPWGDNTALLEAEASMNGCVAPRKSAIALHKEYGDTLPPLLRAYALAADDKKADATKLLVSTMESQAITGACPSEHPTYFYRLSRRLKYMFACIKTLDPKRDVKPLKRHIDRANDCAANSHTLG